MVCQNPVGIYSLSDDIFATGSMLYLRAPSVAVSTGAELVELPISRHYTITPLHHYFITLLTISLSGLECGEIDLPFILCFVASV